MKARIKGEARRKIILDGYVKNEPLKDIAARIGCSLASLKVSASKLGCTRTYKDAAAFRRGFHVPEDKRADYYQLMVYGGYSAHECAEILGLLTVKLPSPGQTGCETEFQNPTAPEADTCTPAYAPGASRSSDDGSVRRGRSTRVLRNGSGATRHF